ncbi:MAG: EAL domain-containing protein [Proteobacteria bacterium]|nr:EAL domain-containing protein [Pseudomonadota bacterium]NOG60483.1 EAL domain-containing protein [Pseudomonadota bacterium]
MKNEEKILIIDDEINVLRAIKRQLRGKFNIDTANGGEEALALINATDSAYAVVVSDMNMPGISGLELLEYFKIQSPNMIRIMLTGNADQETAQNAVNQGEVFRFLTKPCSSEKLTEVIELALECYRDRERSKEKLRSMRQHVDTLSGELNFTRNSDSITSLPNHSSFETFLKDSFNDARNTNTEHSLCYIDIDQFNVINDVCGRDAGDELLLIIAETIRKEISHNHMLARIGGDEFGLLLLESNKNHALTTAQNIKKSIDNLQFIWDTKRYSISISCGIASNRDTNSAEELFKLASSACSYAKSKGRNCIYSYSCDDVGLLQHNEELSWVNRINEALDENRFQLFFQPIVPTNKNNTHYHYEILIRMIDESGGLVMPGDFLPTVEKYNFARRLDRWVISNVFCWLSGNPEHVKNLELCSINLSGNTITDPDITSFILQHFVDYDIPPEKISFEITETAAISNFEVAMEFILSLKKLGCCFALDDFGSGLSSFAYLKKLPVDYLKIDGQFVKDMVDDPIDHEIVKSINSIGHTMNMNIIAEYVENEKIFSSLKLLGVDFAQGYGLGKPTPLEQFEEIDIPKVADIAHGG